MLDKEHPGLSLTRQCNLLGINRSSVYYRHQPISPEDLELMKLIDEQYMKTPVYGSRMGLEAIYPKPRTSKPHPGHRIYPYLLKGLDINRPDMVWASDITYIPLRHGFMYLMVVMDWHSRKVLSWRISNTLDADFCVSALEEAISHYGRPGIFNTDQGSQFTSEAFTSVLKSNGIRISMDGRGRYLDNIFVERLWWTVKYHYLHLHSFKDGLEMQKGLRSWFEYYNHERTHQSLDRMTPDECYFKEQMKQAA